MDARPRGGKIDTLTRSECLNAIIEARLGEEDTEIAKLYFINRMAQADIAAEMGVTRCTISRHLPRIITRILYAAKLI